MIKSVIPSMSYETGTHPTIIASGNALGHPSKCEVKTNTSVSARNEGTSFGGIAPTNST